MKNFSIAEAKRLRGLVRKSEEVSLFERLHLLERYADQLGGPELVKDVVQYGFDFDLDRLEGSYDDIEAAIHRIVNDIHRERAWRWP
ncbi:MAG: hypothetical protein AAGL24_09910 [Pseudomonadota bacterium]